MKTYREPILNLVETNQLLETFRLQLPNLSVAKEAGGRGEALRSAALVQSCSYTACRGPVLAKGKLCFC